MTDLLDELRAVNPAPLDTVPAPEHVRLGAPRRRWRPLAVALPLLAALGFGALSLVGETAPSLARQAYERSRGPGIVHWRIDTSVSVDGQPPGCCGRRTEGWALGARRRVVDYSIRRDGSAVLTDEQIVRGRRVLVYNVRTGNALRFHLSARELRPGGSHTLPLDGSDPMRAFRWAFDHHRLERIGPARFRVVLAKTSGSHETATYEIDPRTALPTVLRLTDAVPAARGRHAHVIRSTWRFSVYRRVPVNPSTLRNLRLDRRLPRPAPERVAIRHFAVLRDGPRPSAAVRARLARLAGASDSQHRLDPAAARTVARGVWVVPGPGHICLEMRASRGAIGGSCATIGVALRRGVAGGSAGGPQLVLVPDGVVAVRARLPGHPWRRFAVHGNLARLPNLGYLPRLERR